MLLHAAAHVEDFGDAGDALQAALDRPIGQRTHLTRRQVARLAFLDRGAHTDEKNLAHERCHRRHEGLHAFGQLLARALQALLHEHTRLVDVGVPAELGIDEREGHVRVRAQAGEAGHAHERAFDGLGDTRLDFLRREAGSFGQDDDGGLGQVGQHLDGQLRWPSSSPSP
jgi:hypothetical protein